ncbi:MAG: hypothetical protein FD121_1542, partial [Gallionellaceae bacterium]
GYEPDELPDCSTPRLRGGIVWTKHDSVKRLLKISCNANVFTPFDSLNQAQQELNNQLHAYPPDAIR